MRSATTPMCSSAMSTQQHRELVAAQPRRGVGRAQRRAQALGRGLEHRVAGLVPVGVVDRLEVVEVDVDHDRVAGAALERVVDAVHEEQPVGEAGERIVERLVLEVGLQVAQLVDLGGQAVLAQHRAGLPRERVEEADLRALEAPRRLVTHADRARRDAARAPRLPRALRRRRGAHAAGARREPRRALGARRLFSRLRQVALEAADAGALPQPRAGSAPPPRSPSRGGTRTSRRRAAGPSGSSRSGSARAGASAPGARRRRARERALGDRDLAERGRVDVVGHQDVAAAEPRRSTTSAPASRAPRSMIALASATLAPARGRPRSSGIVAVSVRSQRRRATRAPRRAPPRRRTGPSRAAHVVGADVEAAEVERRRAGAAARASKAGICSSRTVRTLAPSVA